MSRAELAALLPGRSERQLACWEDAAAEPTFHEVDETVTATGTTLATVLSEPDLDPHDAGLLTTTLALTVAERLERLVAHVRFVEAGRAAMRAAG